MQDTETPGLLASAGLVGVLALALGLGLLGLGMIVAVKRGSRAHALALMAASLLPFVLGTVGAAVGTIGAFDEVVKLGPAVTPKDLAAGGRVALSAAALGTLATILALAGAVAALSRSRAGTDEG
jgi:hypothetical protein